MNKSALNETTLIIVNADNKPITQIVKTPTIK